MTDETDKQAGNRAEHGSHEGKKAILRADVGVGNRARNSNKATQNKKQRCADADGNNCFDRKLLHFLSPLRVIQNLAKKQPLPGTGRD